MSHYEKRLENDLLHIRDQVKLMAGRVETAVENAVHALLTGNKELASSTILADGHINRAMRDLDSMCHSFIAVHLPSAGHLRLVSSIFRSNIILERIGDYAVTICREMYQLSAPPEGAAARGIELMAHEAREVLQQSVQAFEESNVELARGTVPMANGVQASFSSVFEDLLDTAHNWPLQDRFAIFVVYHRLERIADQAKNLCEETVFLATGETKAKKVYQILFVDDDDACLAPLAAAIARKNFPNSGRYSSAGVEAAAAMQTNMANFMVERGEDLRSTRPKKFDFTAAELGEFYVIVGLGGAAEKLISQPPFHTVMLDWDIANVPPNADVAELEAAHRQLAVRIKDLMIDLRGEDAS